MFVRRTVDRSGGHGVMAMEPLEQLEPRLVLSTAPLPSIGDMENPNHTVVRLDTNFGDIDFELLDDVAPNTVVNFLNYVRDGDYDSTIFHRKATIADSGVAVLQGGGFRFSSSDTDGNGTPDGATAVPTDAPIANEFGRSNVARTVAMAKTSNPDSATSQFFINMVDNSTALDNPNNSGGFTVFARVLDDASWNVLMTINGLGTINLGSPLNQLPVADGFDGTPSETNLVYVSDAEVIKPAGTTSFYTQTVYYPEGFSGSTINEFLPMGNPNNSILHYQVIARAEINPARNGVNFDNWYRDRVISTGTINPNSRGGITVSRFTPGTGAPSASDLLPQGVPYSLEVQATSVVSANLSHFDFGSATGESFTSQTSTTWAFGEAHKDTSGGQFEFVVWQNPNPQDVNVTITFYINNQSPLTRTFTTSAFRRGGLAFNNFADLPDNSTFAMSISSDQPIVAALSQYDNSGPSPEGSTTLGIADAASQFGVMPMAGEGTNADSKISVLNPGSTSAVVSFFLYFNDGRPVKELPARLIMSPHTRQTFDFGTVTGLANPDRFSVVYTSNAPVYATTRHVDSFTLNSGPISDAIANPVPVTAATRTLFAEGFMDPSRAGVDVFESVSIYNPNSVLLTGTDTAVNVSVRIYYTDGFALTENRTIPAGQRVDLDLNSLTSVLDQGANNGRFYYSLDVTSDLPVVAQMIHYDLTLGNLQPSGGFSTVGTQLGTVTRLDAL